MAARMMRLLCSVLYVMIVLVRPSYLQNSAIVMGPVDSQAAVGTDAVFYCKVHPGGQLIYWVVNRNIGLGPNENTNLAYPRYEISGQHDLGYYNLRIRNVSAADAVRYDCVVDNIGGASNYEAGAMLTVVNDVVPPAQEAPECDSAPTGDVTYEEGDEIPNYSCQAMNGIPLAELAWKSLRSDQSLIDLGFDVQVDGSSVTATSTKYVLTAADHDSQMACTLTHPGVSGSRTCYVPSSGKILVRHVPVIEFGPEISVHYLETTRVTVRCTATAYPAIQIYPTLTFSDPERALNVTRREFGLIEGIIEVSQSDVGKHINCTAVNAEGETTNTLEITLQPSLPPWLLITVLIAGAVLVLFLMLCCCLCCCGGCKGDKGNRDQPDLGDAKAAGYDVNESRAASMYKPNGLASEEPPQPMDFNDDSFTDIPLNDYTDYPPPPSMSEPATISNDHETGEVNDGYVDGYLTPTSQDRFPPMIEDEHLMGDKPLSTFKPSATENDYAPPPPPSPPPPPPPMDLDYPTPIPPVEAE